MAATERGVGLVSARLGQLLCVKAVEIRSAALWSRQAWSVSPSYVAAVKV